MRNHLLTLLFLFFSFLANCQVTVEPEPRWIFKESYNPSAEPPEEGVNGGAHILLYTEQVHVDREERYIKSVSKAVEYSGIQNISTVVADYDPSYQKLRFHHIDVIRNGEVINKLKKQDIQTARRETNAENYIYDGTMTAFVNVPDVRIGDLLLYSYSIKGFNPIQKGKFSTSFILNSTQPIDRISAHILSSRSVSHKQLNSDIEVKVDKTNGRYHYVWQDEQVPAFLMEEQTPSWYIPNATILITEYDSWSDVISWGKEIFTFEEPLNKQLKDEIKNIYDNNATEGEKIRAALAFVQNEIRYLAVHSGIGGYKPNPPNKVVEQRFGDCKDKSVLLAAMLTNMGIEAYPTLVNTQLRKIMTSLPPSSKIFDHCIVKVIDEKGTTLWYDPTLTNQGGTFNTMYTPNYNYGLVLDSKLSAMDTIANFGNNMIETFTTFDIAELGKGADLEVRTHYYEGEADFIRAIFKNNSKDVIAKELLAFYTETYGSTSSLAPPTIVDDTLKNEFILLQRYTLDSIWRPSTENPDFVNLSIYPTSITNSLTMPSELNRTSPFALSYPMVRTQHITLKLPEGIRAKAENSTIISDYFYYDFNSDYDRSSNTLHLKYYYKSQDDHVPADDFTSYYRDMVKLDQQIGYLITSNKKGGFSSNSVAFNIGQIIGYGMAVVTLIGLIVVAIIFIQRRISRE